MTIAKLELQSNDPLLANYRRVAKQVGDTPAEFTAWVNRVFERGAALDDREAAAKAREAALDRREDAIARREHVVAAQLSAMQARLSDLVGEPAA
jgi:hypothetical protein